MHAKYKWWDEVIKSDTTNYYRTAEQARNDNGAQKPPSSGRKGTYIWGDRVRILERQPGVTRVSARGVEYWVHNRHLGGEPLLEVYVIDVGQGDGLLGPVESEVNGAAALKKFPDGDAKNTNGHSVVLRLDYGERRILLTGDLNTHSQHHIMDHYGAAFFAEYKSDVAKGCHHGSHDVSYRFLEGMRPLCTVISSGDAETHDHPRPTIVAASAITGRRLVDHERDSLICPLIYITEVARSVAITKVGVMKEYAQPQPRFEPKKPIGADIVHNTEDEKARFRLFLGTRQSSPFHWPRLDVAKVVRGLRYGLINIRTDGKRLFFAQMEESGKDWAFTALTPEQIAEAR